MLDIQLPKEREQRYSDSAMLLNLLQQGGIYTLVVGKGNQAFCIKSREGRISLLWDEYDTEYAYLGRIDKTGRFRMSGESDNILCSWTLKTIINRQSLSFSVYPMASCKCCGAHITKPDLIIQQLCEKHTTRRWK
jgi:hypothetical protein